MLSPVTSLPLLLALAASINALPQLEVRSVSTLSDINPGGLEVPATSSALSYNPGGPVQSASTLSFNPGGLIQNVTITNPGGPIQTVAARDIVKNVTTTSDGVTLTVTETIAGRGITIGEAYPTSGAAN
ncbi:hypothetical protein P7C73_g3610, partial [Tremellales sp. Uapishka_1]